jgi:ATP-dependent helicase/nuclease subunit A
MDGRSFDRFEQLIELAQSYDGEPDLTPGGFAALARERRVESPDRAAVRVMTIHAAKGLEFDAVVLPDLGSSWGLRPGQMLVDRPRPFEPPDAVSCYVEQALLPWSDEIRRVHEACRDRQVVEDLCGLYVAMTRPVHALEVIVQPRETKGHSLSAAGVLRGAFTADGSATSREVLYEAGDANWCERVAEREEEEAATGAVVALSWPEQDGVALHRVRRQSPSSLEGGQVVRAEDALRAGTTRALALGTLVHHWFELVEWADDPPSAGALRAVAADDADVPADEVEPMIESFLARLTSGPIAEALRRDAYADRARETARVDVKREWLFAVRDADAEGRTILLSGQFDRVVIGRDADGRAMWADIVDYKTDVARPGETAGAAARVEHYRPQVEAYRRAAARLLGIAVGQVTARLAFTQLDAVVAVEALRAAGD